jgi:hypothetical protein
MLAWFRRLWDYLRRLLVGDDEDTGGITDGGLGRPDPDEGIGRELQGFFLELLQDHNLREYRDRRDDYINSRRSGLSPDAQRLLDSGDLKELEEHIGAITGSRAVLLFVVCPPM